MSLEKIVRPAQSPDNQPPKLFRQRRSSANWQPVILKFGNNGGTPSTGSASISQSISFYTKKRPKETKNNQSFLGITWP